MFYAQWFVGNRNHWMSGHKFQLTTSFIYKHFVHDTHPYGFTLQTVFNIAEFGARLCRKVCANKSHYFAIILYQLKEVARRYNKDLLYITVYFCSLHFSISALRDAISLLRSSCIKLNINWKWYTKYWFRCFSFFIFWVHTVRNNILRATGNWMYWQYQ